MSARVFMCAILCSLGLWPSISLGQERRPDALTRELFQLYLTGGKIGSDTRHAATVLVAERGRNDGFWKEILTELQAGNERAEADCVNVLGLMLAVDARARDIIRNKEITAWAASVNLSPEVVEVLLERGRRADRQRVDYYVVALMRARVPESREFFQAIIGQDSGRSSPRDDTLFAQPLLPSVESPNDESTNPRPDRAPAPISFPDGGEVRYSDSAKFHAAVGLAQLGHREGIMWLIGNCENPNGFVQYPWPYRGEATAMGKNCMAALYWLSGEKDFTTKAEWVEWAKTADFAQMMNRAVPFQDAS